MLTAHISSLMEMKGGTWRQELKQKAERNTSLACSLDLLSLLSYLTQDHHPRQKWHGVQWAGSSLSIMNQKKNILADLPTGQSDGGNLGSLFPDAKLMKDPNLTITVTEVRFAP